MKVSKTEGQNKASRKAAKKELEQSLTAKLVEVVKSLGHDAEKIGEDLILVSKFVAKKISKRVNGGAREAEKKAADALSIEQGKKTVKPSKEKKSDRKKKDEDPKGVKATVKLDIKPGVEAKRNKPEVKAKPSEPEVKAKSSIAEVKAKPPVANNAKKETDQKGLAKKGPQKKAIPTLKPIATSVKVNVVPFEDQEEPVTTPPDIKRSNPVAKSTKAKPPVKKNKPASDPDTEHIN